MLSGLCRVSTSPADRNHTCCTSYAECDDRNACTKDECNLTTNTCVHTMSLPPSTPPDECKQWDCRLSDGVWNLVPTSDGMACRDDGNSCTLDRCQMGACAHPALPSPTTPPMPCYQWSCLGGSTGWIQTPNDTLSCDDGNPCTNTACRSGHCQDITTPAEASLLCPRPRCTALDAATTCDDRDPCTVDTCSSGFCRNSPVTAASIDDSNLCTQDMCSPDRGITHTPLVFNDNNVCTTDSCDARTGLPLFVPRPVEDDGNPCTKDVCDPVFGMLHSLDISRGYECFEGSDCDMSTCRRRIVSIPTCTVDCRQTFMSLIGIRVVPQNESNVQCAFSLNTQGVTGISCRGESGDFTTSGSLPVETGTTGLKTIRAFCKTPSDYRFSCEDNLSVIARVGSGGSGGQVGSGGMNGAAGSGGISLQASGGGSGRGSAGSGGISPPIPTVVGFSNYDVYFCVANETTAFNLRGERIELATPCPELPVAQAVEDDQRLIAETLLDVDPASDHFAQNVRP
ncbi:MAG: hypothetical protein IPJ69_13765 [Deltaproteobacteria bacterium]|nr:MAG: hypothetical protein IPJ69_13765 [Deltaproteobacteria bacterium]